MKADDIKRAERSKQRGNTSRPSGNDNDAAVPEPFEIDNDTDENDNDSDNDNREDYLFSNDSNNDPDKGGYRLETADRRRKSVPGSVPDKITVPDNSDRQN